MCEQGTRPGDSVADTNARWASGVLALFIANLPSGDKDVGWTTNSIPPFKVANSISRSVYEWLEYLDVNARIFSDLGDAGLGLVAGQPALVDEYDPSTDWLAKVWGSSIATNPAEATCVASDGIFNYYGTSNGRILAVKRDDGTTVDSLNHGVQPTAIFSDGKYVHFVDVAGEYFKFAVPDLVTGWGALLGSYVAHGAALNGVYPTGDAVFIVGAPGVGGNTIRKLDYAEPVPAVVASNATHDAPLHDIKSDGFFVFATGERDTANLTTRRLAYDLATIPSSYDHGADTFALSVGKDGVYIGGVNSGGSNIRRLSYPLITAVWGGAVQGGATVAGIGFDGRYVYATGNRGGNHTLSMVQPETGFVMRTFDHGAGFNMNDLAVDMLGLFVAGDRNNPGDDTLAWRHHVVAKPILVRKCDGTERWRWPLHIGVVTQGVGDDRI